MSHETNVFDPDFLSRFGDLNLPASSYEAETAGPWRVESRSQDRHKVRQHGDEEPAAVVAQRETALLLAAVTPLEARAPLYRLDDTRQTEGYRLQYEAATEGWLRYYRPEVVEALNLVAHLVRSPVALALVLEAAGSVALGRAGEILRRVPEGGFASPTPGRSLAPEPRPRAPTNGYKPATSGMGRPGRSALLLAASPWSFPGFAGTAEPLEARQSPSRFRSQARSRSSCSDFNNCLTLTKSESATIS